MHIMTTMHVSILRPLTINYVTMMTKYNVI